MLDEGDVAGGSGAAAGYEGVHGGAGAGGGRVPPPSSPPDSQGRPAEAHVNWGGKRV